MVSLATNPYAKLSDDDTSAGSLFDPAPADSSAMAYAPPAPAPKTPTPKAAPAAPPPPAQQAGLLDRWNEFMDHPEHRAGMMQFAVNMLSGRGLGESIGAAAEATGRNVGAQQEEARALDTAALKQQEAARKERETEYYGIGQKDQGDKERRFYDRQDAMFDRQTRAKARDAYFAFKNDPGTSLGIWRKVQARFPELKDKTRADMTPEHDAYARRLIEDQLGVPTGSGFKAPEGSEQRMGSDGRIHYFDPKTKKYLGSE